MRSHPAFTGESPQARHEEAWQSNLRRRLQVRGAIGAAALVGGALAHSVAFGVMAGVTAAAMDAGVHGWRRRASRVWRLGQRGDRQTARLLHWTLGWRGYRIVRRRLVPGYEHPITVVAGPTGVWLVDSEAWAPDSGIGVYGRRLFIGKRSGSDMAASLVKAANTLSDVLSREVSALVTAEPLVVVHGGRFEAGGGVLHGEGITLTTPRRLPGMLTAYRGSVHDAELVEAVALAAARVLPRVQP